MNDDTVNKSGYMIILPWELNKVGGVNQVVKSILHEINTEGTYKSHLFINSWVDKKDFYDNKNNTLIHRSRLRQICDEGMFFKTLFMFIASLPFEIKKLVKLINNNKVTIINAHFPELNLITFAIIKRLFTNKFKFILSFHGSDVKAITSQSTFEKLQWRFIINAADKIVPCSYDLANKLIEVLPSAKNKISVIHNGINPKEIYRKLDKGFTVHNDQKPFIISIGTLDENKGHDKVIHAFSELSKKDQSEINLVILGKDTSYSNTLDLMIEDLKLQESIYIYKDIPHEDTIKTLSGALFLILASSSEGYPLVLLEAGLMKTAVIASEVGGIPELIKHKETGVLINNNDHQNLVRVVSKLIQNQNGIRKKYGDNLHKKVITQSWLSVYKSYIAGDL